MSARPGDDERAIRTAERLLDEVRAEIGRADTKASVLIGALGACAGLVLGSYWDRAPDSGAGLVLSVTGAVAWAAALGFLLFATVPRYRHRSGGRRAGAPLTYFLDIREAGRGGSLVEALRATERDRLLGLAIALRDTSEIATAKHRWIATGLGCFVAGGLVLGAGALLSL
ncbi:hypothetical protein GTY77_12790 [Streptomyces sp. SID8380]|nr:hypothetical protein [Streptomyces sp. SID8380]